jgi:hypothetical protein
MKVHYCLLFILSLNFVQIVNANDSKEGKPPKESVNACSNKSPKDQCNFIGKDGDAIHGHCKKAGDSNILFCFGDMPPKESVDACNGKAPKESCEFVGKDGQNITGVCFKDKHAPVAHCRPEKH